MANEIVPDNMSKALNQIDRLRGLIVYRCTRGDIRLINEPLRKDIADLRAAVDALDQAFQKECERSNRTGATGAHKLKMRTKLLLFAALLIGLVCRVYCSPAAAIHVAIRRFLVKKRNPHRIYPVRQLHVVQFGIRRHLAAQPRFCCSRANRSFVFHAQKRTLPRRGLLCPGFW